METRRLLSAGDLDVAFSGDGKASIDLPGVTNEVVNATLVQPDGKVLFAGKATVGSETDFFVARLTTAGILDPTFSTDGVATIDFGVNDEANDLALDSTGRIVVVGTTGVGATGTNARHFAIARLTDFGGLNVGTFSTDGKTTVDFDFNAEAQAVAIDGNNIYVGGFKDLGSSGHFALVKLLDNGSQDTTYSTDGEVFFGFGATNDSRCYDIAIDSNHRVVMVGYDRVSAATQRNFAYARVGTNALLDPSFSGDGLAVTDFNFGDDEARSVAIDLKGNLVVGGYADLGGTFDDFAATRLSEAGALDNSFNGDGRFSQSLNASNELEIVEQLAVQNDGDITLVGTTTFGSNEAVMLRLNGFDGQLSTTFGDNGDGIQRFDLGTLESGFTVALDPRDARAVVAGNDGAGHIAVVRTHDLIDQNFAANVTGPHLERLADGKLLVGSSVIRRLLVDGSEDLTFTHVSHVGQEDDFDVDSQGRIITAGEFNDGSNIVCFVARNLPNGAPDPSFSGDGIMTFRFSAVGQSNIAALEVDSLDRIVVVGSTTLLDDSAIARITPTGVLDTSFDGDGINVVVVQIDNFDAFYDVKIQSDGKIVALGENVGISNGDIVRFNANGNIDLGYATLGINRFSGDGPHFVSPSSLTFDNSGRAIVCGATSTAGPETDGLLIRFTTGGSIDSSFGSGGKLSLNLGGNVANEKVESVVVDDAGNIITLGNLTPLDTNTSMVIVRKLNFNATSGVFSFGGDGAWVSPEVRSFAGGVGSTVSMILDEGALLVGGLTGVFRLNVNPAVVDFRFEYETLPQRLVVQFNDDIGDSLIDGDIVIRNTTTNTTVNTSAYDIVSYNHLTNTAIVNFNSILADGDYTATFSSVNITNRQTMQLAGDRVKDFFFLHGDVNHDRTVNFDDLLTLTQNYGLTGKTFSQGNIDYSADGLVAFGDLLLLAQRYGSSLSLTSTRMPGKRRADLIDL